jgi:hypothetical protein
VGSQGLVAVAEEEGDEDELVRGESPKGTRRAKKLSQEWTGKFQNSQSAGNIFTRPFPKSNNDKDFTTYDSRQPPPTLRALVAPASRPPGLDDNTDGSVTGEDRRSSGMAERDRDSRLESNDSGTERDLEWTVRKALSKQQFPSTLM